MLKVWTLLVVPMTIQILTINSILMHDIQVMKERNFGKVDETFEKRTKNVESESFARKFKLKTFKKLKVSSSKR